MASLNELKEDLAEIEELIAQGKEFVEQGYPMAAEINAMNVILWNKIKRKIEEPYENIPS